MPNKNKNRLYITLLHRMEHPGFHWAIGVSPKYESSDVNVCDSHVFHVTNTRQPGVPVDANGKVLWRYEERPQNSMQSGRLVGRILIAKLAAKEPLRVQAKQIDDIVRNVPLIQDDDEWTCRVWVEQALAALRATGGDFGTIPQVTVGSETEAHIMAFGEEAMDKVRSGKGPIKEVTDLLHTDMRVR